ncbi:MAG: hypothetical protein ABIQ56_05290 [Chitinophagaceae bacterium]
MPSTFIGAGFLFSGVRFPWKQLLSAGLVHLYTVKLFTETNYKRSRCSAENE